MPRLPMISIMKESPHSVVDDGLSAGVTIRGPSDLEKRNRRRRFISLNPQYLTSSSLELAGVVAMEDGELIKI